MGRKIKKPRKEGTAKTSSGTSSSSSSSRKRKQAPKKTQSSSSSSRRKQDPKKTQRSLRRINRLTVIPPELREIIEKNYFSCETPTKQLSKKCHALPSIIELLKFVDECLYFSENPPDFPANQGGMSDFTIQEQKQKIGDSMNEDEKYLEKTKLFINDLINKDLNMTSDLDSMIDQITNDSTNPLRIENTLKTHKTFYDNLKNIHEKYEFEKTNRDLY